MDNKSIYNNLFQSDETFRSNFPEQSDFDTYVSQEGKLDEVKDLYNYQEPDTEDPVKKKEERRSPFRSLFRSFGDRGKSRDKNSEVITTPFGRVRLDSEESSPSRGTKVKVQNGKRIRVEVGETKSPRDEAIAILNNFKEKEDAFASLRSELAIYDLPFKSLTSPVSTFVDLDPEGDYRQNPAIIKARDERNQIMVESENSADALIDLYFGSPFISQTETNEEGEIEIVSQKISDSGKKLIDDLATEKPDLVSTNLGYDKNFLRVVDTEKVRQLAGWVYGDAFSNNDPDMESDPRFKIISEKLYQIAQDGINQQNSEIEISKALRKNFPDDKRIQKDGYKAVENIAKDLTTDLWKSTKELEIEENDAISLQLNEYKTIEKDAIADITGRINQIKEVYDYDEVTGQFLPLPDQADALQAELAQFNEYRDQVHDQLAESKKMYIQRMNDISLDYRRQIVDVRKSIIDEYTLDDATLNRTMKEAYESLNSKMTAMEVAAYMKNPLYNIAQAWMQGSGSLFRGAADILDIYFSPFGSAGTGVSTSIRNFGEDLLKYDFKYFNPTYEMAGSDPMMLTKKAVYDFARMGPTLLPTIGLAISGAPTWATASVGLFTDTAMESDEVRKQVYEQTGDRIKAEQAAEDKVSDNLNLGLTYFADAKLLTPGGFGKITNMADALFVNSVRTGSNYVEELFQEGMQEASTRGILDRYIHNKESDYSFLDQMQDPELMKSVAGMTLISQGISGSFDTYRQLNQQKIVNRVNSLLDNKGMANLLNRANKVSENAIGGFYEMQYMMGNLTKDQLGDIKKAVKREAQFAKASNIIAPNESEEKQSAVISLLKEKDQLESQIDEIENQSAKDALKKKVKEVDKQIEKVSESKSLEGFTVIKNKETGTIIAAVKDEEFKEMLASNPDAHVLLDGVMVDVLEVKTGDQTINDMVEHTALIRKDNVELSKRIQSLVDRNKVEARKRELQKKNGETPTLTDEEFNKKFTEEFKAVLKERDERVANMKKDGAKVQEEIDRYKKQNEDSSISGVEFDPIFNVDENTNFDDIKLTFNNSKISTIVDQVKESIPMLRQLYGNAKITFVKSNQEMESLGYKNSEGLFDPDTNTMFINLEGATEYTVFHELTHGALIKAFGEDTAVLFTDFMNEVDKALGVEDSKRLKAFISNYSQDMRPEEYLAQLGAFLGIEQNKLKPTVATRIKSLIYDTLMRLGLKDFASKFNNSYNQKRLFDMFNSMGRAYKTKDFSEFLKKADDVFKARSENNAHLRNKSSKVNRDSVEFSEGVLSELSKDFGIAQEQSAEHGIRYDKENNTIIANESGVISTDQYFSVISDVLLHNYIKNNVNEFLDLADQIDRANYKKLRGLYEKDMNVNELSKRAQRSFYSFMSNGTQIKNMNQLWDAISNYYVGTSVNKTAGLYTLGARYFNKKTESSIGVTPLSDEKLKDLTKIAKGTSIYNVIDLHKNGYSFYTISNRVRQSINRSKIVDIAIDNFRLGGKFPEYEVIEDHIDRPSINIVNNTINIPYDMTEDENLRLMYNVLLLDMQRNNPSLFMELLNKMSSISGYEEMLNDYKAQYLDDVANREEPDEKTAMLIFDKMIDAFIMKTDNLLDDITDEGVSRIENEIFNEYTEPFEIPMVRKNEAIDYIIYKMMDPNAPVFSDLRFKNVKDYHVANELAFAEIVEMVENNMATIDVKVKEKTDFVSMDLDETVMTKDDVVDFLDIKVDNVEELKEKIGALIEGGETSFVSKAQEIVDKYSTDESYDPKFKVPAERLGEILRTPSMLELDSLVYENPEILYDRVFFQEVFNNDPEKMSQYDEMFENLKELEYEIYNVMTAKRFFEKHARIDGNNIDIVGVFDETRTFSRDNFAEEFQFEYEKLVAELTDVESFQKPASVIILNLKNQIIKDLSPMPDIEPGIVTIDKETASGLEMTYRMPGSGNVIDVIGIKMTYDEETENLNIQFESERYGMDDTPSNEKRLFVPSTVAATALSAMSMAPVKSISFTAIESSNKKYKSDPKAFRQKLYEMIGTRIAGSFYYGEEAPSMDPSEKDYFAIAIPPFMNIGRYQMEFEPTVAPSKRVRESRKKAHKNIVDFVDAEKAKGTPASEIYNKAYQMFGDEYVRTSKYGAEYMNERSEFQKKEAMKSMDAFAQNFEGRRQAIIDFVDKFRDKTSLIKIVNILRNGVEFFDEETGFKALDTTLETSGVLNQTDATQRQRPDMSTTTMKFADFEIFSALHAIGETSEDLDKIFGRDYRQTIETAIQEGNFSTNILSALSKDAQSRRVRRRIEDLAALGEVFDDLDPKSVIDYMVTNLDLLGIEPALQNLIGRIKNAETYQELNGEIVNTISDMRATEGEMQSVAQLASFAGRVLRLMRQISDDPSKIILENIRKNGRDIPAGLEGKIKDQVDQKMKNTDAHKKALLDAWADPSDENINNLLSAERDLYEANWNLARTLNSEAVQGRYWSDVLQKHGAFALLSMNTVVLSAASVLELGYRQQFAPVSNFAAFLADKYLSPGPQINGYKVRARRNPLGKDFWKSSALAHKYTFDKNMYQMGKAIRYGQTGTDTNLYYDLPAQANAFRDASNFFKAMMAYAKKRLNKEKITDEDLAEILERSLIEVDGEKKLVGGKSYQLMAAAFRGLNPSFIQSELTARLMPLGLDQYGVNTLMMDTMLDYTSFQMAADYKGMPKGIAASLMERSPEVSLRNTAVLTQSLIAAGYVKSDAMEQEALRATFFNTNALTKGMSGWRKSIRKKMNQQDQKIISELKKGKDKSKTKIALASAGLHGIQTVNLLTYAAVPFLRVPSNIAFMLVKRANPVGAAINALHKYAKYSSAINDVKSKYDKEMGQDITLYQDPTKAIDIDDAYISKEKDIKKKAELEATMMDLYGKKRAYTEAVGDIIFSSTLGYVVYNIVASGAVSPSDDPEKRGVLQETGLESSELNITMLKDYVDAGGPNMTEEERKSWISSRKEKTKGDTRVGLINLGTYFGYSLGFAGDIYSQHQETEGDKNGLQFDSFMKQFTVGTTLGTMSRTVFKMTPSAQFLEEIMQVLDTSKDYQKDMDNLFANLASASAASFAPSLLGKPLSVSEGMKAQSTREIDLEKEISNYPLDLKFLMIAHMRLSRNGIILPGTFRSDFYKSKIGLFGEDLSIRKTLSEPGTAAAYFESMFNFFKLRRETRVMPKNIKDERRLKHEIDKHADINEIGNGVLSMAQAYARLGGDPSSFYSMFNKPLKNRFVITEFGKTEEGLDVDVPITMPNDMFRLEAKMLGEYKYEKAGEIKEIINDAMSYSPDGKEVYGEEQINEFKLKLKNAIDEINSLLDGAEKDYQADFVANRADIMVREMYNRGVLSENDIKKFKEKGIDDSIFESPDIPKWGIDMYEVGNLNFSDPEVYNSNTEEEDEDLSYLDKPLYMPDIDTKDSEVLS